MERPEDRDNLVNKLEKMYGLGIRSFAVFFDDIAGEGARGEKQAELLNYVDSVFVKKHGDIAPLLLCPTIYNRAWSSNGDQYLNALGRSLNPGIEVMWTGNSVVHTIDKESMDWINARIKRKAYIWLNFPVNDFVRRPHFTRSHLRQRPRHRQRRERIREQSDAICREL